MFNNEFIYTTFIKVDLIKQQCNTCNKGIFIETTINDTKQQLLHCNYCNKIIDRYIFKADTKTKSKEELDDKKTNFTIIATNS